MRKPLLSLLLLGGTLLFTWVMALQPADKPVQARFATVERGDVHQVLALEGRVSYADSQYVSANCSGTVTQVCVQKGQRVAAGEALIRLDGTMQEQVISALASQADLFADAIPEQTFGDSMLTVKQGVIRAKENCTVRQVYVSEDAMVTAGTPVALVSSGWQEIICQASARDAEMIVPGMWAWLSAEGEALGTALVESVGEREADSTTGVMYTPVRFRPEQHIDLPVGAVVDVDIFLSGSDDVLSLPLEALTERNTVWWVSDGRCTEIPAEIVMADEMRAWVSLPEGITIALGEFKEGQRIMEVNE